MIMNDAAKLMQEIRQFTVAVGLWWVAVLGGTAVSAAMALTPLGTFHPCRRAQYRYCVSGVC